jgi:hypothetical protein
MGAELEWRCWQKWPAASVAAGRTRRCAADRCHTCRLPASAQTPVRDANYPPGSWQSPPGWRGCEHPGARRQDAFSIWFCLVLLAGFPAGLSTLHSTWLGPVGEAWPLSPAGSALIFAQDVAAAISVIANTGVMLDIGQERSMK